jgi:putative transposase
MDHQLPVAVVCRVLDAPRSTVYARRVRTDPPVRPGPVTAISDSDLLGLIRQVLVASPFAGEGYRKVRARLRREHGIRVGGKRVLRLLRQEGLLAPQRVRGRRKPRPHDGTIIPDGPNQRWGTDATMAWTRVDGWVWVLPASTTTPLRPGRTWPKSATASPPCSRSTTPLLTAGPARPGRRPRPGAAARLGPAIPLGHFTSSIAWLGIADSPAFLGEPETNGCAERWIRTLKEQCLWTTLYDTIDELRQAVADFVERYNRSWLIQRHGHRTPKEAYQAAQSASAA